ncbi:MAG TPA: ISNCY family transposase, partial [Candidatus Competibacteraceae bacterium]|nr:ISNCY family transposase [Candidatus Competibacteraceae bacterium]
MTTLDAVIGVTLQVRRCVNPACEFYHRPYRPESEGRLALPHHEFGLDIIAWIGAQRYQAYCSLPEIHRDLQAQGVVIAARTVDHLLARYEELVSVAVEAPARRAALRQQGRLILALDGLQPDKGQEVLWVIREVLSGEILAARSLLVSSQAELSDLLREALVGLEGIPVKGVISDGQLAVRQAVAQVLPGIPHQLCQFHYLREAGRPIWEADRHAEKALRKRVRGIRTIERQGEARTDAEAEITRGYCAAVRGALSDPGQPPLEAGGLQLQQRLSLIEASLNRVPNKGGSAPLNRLDQCLHRSLEATAPLWPELVIAHGWLEEAAHLLANPDGADSAAVQARYAVLLAAIQQEAAPTPQLQQRAAEVAKVTASDGTQGFPCYDVAGLPRTHNDLEPLFGGVRHHLRRATGQKNAPASLVVCGATRLPAAVASRTHRFTAADLAAPSLERWRAKRTLLEQRRLPRILGRRFRQDPEAYLQTLE